MRILAVEDEVIFANALEMLLDELGYELIAIAKSSQEFLRLFASSKPDLVLLDINIQGTMDGIELAKHIMDSTFAVPVIFITSYTDSHTFERAKKSKPYAYLTKPIEESALQRSIELAFDNFSKTSFAMTGSNRDILIRDHFFVKVDQNLVKIKVDDIICVEAEDKYCTIFSQDQKLLVRMSLKDIYAKLPPNHFIQIHKGAIVNINFVQNVHLKDNFVQVDKQKQLPIGKNFRHAFLEKLNLLD